LQKESGEDGEEDDEEEEEEEDDDNYDDEDLDEDEEGLDDSCPAGCDPSVHQKVILLRERRLDLEEVLQDFQKRYEAGCHHQ